MTDHAPYIHAVVLALRAAGLEVPAEAITIQHEPRSASIRLDKPDVTVRWRPDGWVFLLGDKPFWWPLAHEAARPIVVVAHLMEECEAVAEQVYAQTPSDLDSALAAYHPAPEPGPADPRQIATRLIREHADGSPLLYARAAVSAAPGGRDLARAEFTARVAEVTRLIDTAVLIPTWPEDGTR